MKSEIARVWVLLVVLAGCQGDSFQEQKCCNCWPTFHEADGAPWSLPDGGEPCCGCPEAK